MIEKIEEKIEDTKSALDKCLTESCGNCPYCAEPDCKNKVYSDSLEVITWLQDKLTKKASEPSSAKPTFIVLTILDSGEKIAVKLDDISYIHERTDGTGSNIYLKQLDGARISVAESIIDILEKVSEGKSE